MGTPNIKPEASSPRTANIQMQGFAAGDVEPVTPGIAGLLSRSAATKDPGAGANPEKFLSASIRSEPDMDTIMPLTGSYSHSQPSPGFPFQNWSGKNSRRDGAAGAGAGGRGHVEGSDESSEEDADAERSLVYSPRSIGFTNVEVNVLHECAVCRT